jgi:enoyl-CoA hydratase/carnithine racemase
VDGLAEGDVDRQLAFADAFIGLHSQLRRMGTPVVCAVNGRCHAAGMSLLLAADMAVAAEHATFGYPEIEEGLFPVLALASAVRLLPRKLVFELCYTGRLLSAREALDLGIINKVVPREELEQATSDLVAAIASRSQRALRIGRLAFHVMERADPDLALEYGKPSLVSLLAGEVPRNSGWA